jgi:hypothetical protein
LRLPPFGAGNGADFGAVVLQQVGEDRKARAAEMRRHVLHPDRVAQVGLVAAIPHQAVAIGNARPVGIDLAAAAEFLEHPCSTGCTAAKTSSWSTKLISISSW